MKNIKIGESKNDKMGRRGIYFDADNSTTNITISNVTINTFHIRSDGINLNGLVGVVNNTIIMNVFINTIATDSPGISISGSNPIATSGGRIEQG
jgi:hypothetical protein